MTGELVWKESIIMRGVFTRIKKYMLPQTDTEVIKNVDTESVYNIHRVTLVVMIFETITLLTFYATRKVIDRAALISIFSVSACVLFSGVTFLSLYTLRIVSSSSR